MARPEHLAAENAAERFDAALRAHFADPEYRFFSLRTNGGRVLEAVRGILTNVDTRSGTILNVGSGAFVVDFLLERESGWNIVSIDREAGYGDLYRELRRKDLLTRTSFIVADVQDCEFMPGSLDAVLIHDVLFTPGIDLYRLLPKFAGWLRPDGLLVFDVWDRRMRPVWRLAGRDHGFSRYDLTRVRKAVRTAGFRLIAESPYFGTRRVLRGVRKMLWVLFGLSNTRHFTARLTRSPMLPPNPGEHGAVT